MRRILAYVGTVAVVLACLAVPNYAKADATTVVQETGFAWTPARTVEAGAEKLDGNTVGVTTVSGAVNSVVVRAKGVECWTGEWPTLKVSVGGTVLGTQTVVGTAYANYTFPASAATGQVKLEFGNEFTGYYFGGVCKRTLYVDNATVTTTDATTTPPSTTTSTTPTTTTSTPTTTSNPPVTTTPPAPVGGEYVAMGDSYSSGEGSDRSPQSPTRDNSVYAGNQCGRSTNAAPYKIAAEKGYTLKFVACGGAATANILTTGIGGEPAQITQLTANTKLVTLTIGGNDVGLLYMIQVCGGSFNCWRGSDAGWFSAASYIAQYDAKIAQVQAQLEAILRQVAQRSPQATVLMAGYPYILPPTGQPVNSCALPTAGQEQAYFVEATQQINNKIKAAVQAVAASTGKDYRYVDPQNGTFPANETDCSLLPTRYMNGNDGQQGYWHPNIRGQRLYANLYEGALG